jgi:hypothetical protein
MYSLAEVVKATLSATPSGVAVITVALPLCKNLVSARVSDEEFGTSGVLH